ncbi:MAG TPA: crosslink repair DNA glycosylase YcaQ family protein [Propionibacteriaceae bacterium]|nr:crosslink repair DNA glycosylase YcaQ family protein [Propionibacteriaceae bacterium]
MTRLGPEELAGRTLRRQFPDITGRGSDAVLDLFDRLGPIQSQVPRAPFLAASSRLPGVGYDTVNDLFADHRLVKTSSLRGTVHTSTAAIFPRLDAVARALRATQARQFLELGGATPHDMYAEVERFCAANWRPRAEIVDHIRGWLVERGGAVDTDAGPQSVIWGHSGLLRRPRDTHWERRTDAFHRTASAVLPDLARCAPAEALRDLVLAHLRSYGPVTRADLVFFFGVRPGEVREAEAAAGEAIESVAGEDGQTYLELAEPPTDGTVTPGLRLLPEFDGLLLGFTGPGRTRFCSADELAQIWAKVNGLFAPVVLQDDRLVATWRTLTRGRRTDLEVTMLGGRRALAEDRLSDPVQAVESVLGLTITDVRVHPATR